MTAIQQQRLIGAALVALLVAVLAWFVLASVDSQEPAPTAEADDPIVFDSVVEPISENPDPSASELSARAESATDESVDVPEQSEAKVVIPEQTADSQTAINDESATASDESIDEELTALAEELDEVADTAPADADAQQEKAQEQPAESEAVVQDEVDEKSQQWVIQLGSFSKHENAQSLERQLKEANYDPVIETAEIDGRPIYRVRLPADDDRDRLEDIAAELAESMGFEPQIRTHTP